MSEDSTMGAHNGIPVAPSESDDQIRNEGDIMQEDLEICSHRPYMRQKLSIIILGASGDLAKKKTYPALFDLYRHGYLPKYVTIGGYARSAMTDDDFRAKIRPFLNKVGTSAEIDDFLSRCVYFEGKYDNPDDFRRMGNKLTEMEDATIQCSCRNRLFYFAIPPNVFIPSAEGIHTAAQSTEGWNRIVVEKPFGHDLDSALAMSAQLRAIWHEDQIYRIDHYLGKEMVQNLTIFRFGNTFLEPLLNNRHVTSVKITFKEDFGTMVSLVNSNAM
jgi:glucose-6-phosphate 1-dehydrogenase